MTQTLVVATPFETLEQLAEAFADRTTEDRRLMLYAAEAYEENDTVAFAVLLADGAPAVEGLGRVSAVIDGGPERLEASRWDVVLDSLELDDASLDALERIIETRTARYGADPAGMGSEAPVDVEPAPEADAALAGVEVDVSDGEPLLSDLEGLVESVQPSAPPADEPVAPSAPDEQPGLELDAGEDASEGDVELAPPSLPAPAPPAADAATPEAAAPAPAPPEPGRLLSRPTRPPEWVPRAPTPVPPRGTTGAFSYPPGELPAPDAAPRPPLDPERRVARAPRPVGSAA